MNKKLSLGVKLGYASGDFGGSVAFQTVTLFILFYFTDVFLISPLAAGWILAAGKVWNAVADPMVGFYSDKIQSKMGKKRFLMLIGSFPLGVSFFLLFSSPPLSYEMKILWALLAFMSFSTCYSIVGVPYGALTSIITEDPAERSNLTAYRMVFAILAILSIAGATKPLAGLFGTQQEGFRNIGWIYGIIAMALTLVTVYSVKEQNIGKGESAITFKESLGLVKRNKPFIVLVCSIVIYLTAINLLASMVNYYFKYNLKQESWITIAFLCLFVSSAAALPLWLKLSEKLGKATSFSIGMSFLVFVLMLILFLPKMDLMIVIPVFCLAGLGMSTVYLFPWAMVPDTIDYAEWKEGSRKEGAFYGFFYFAFKASAALAGMISGIFLDFGGYVPNQDQTETALNWIRWLTTVFPAGCIVLGILIFRFYTLDEDTLRKMGEDLKKTRGT